MPMISKTPKTTALPYLSTSSGLKDASAVILARTGILVGILVLTDGTNDATVIIYDNKTTGSGTVLAKMVVPGADKSGGVMNLLVSAENGLYLSLSGTGANAIVYYI